MDENIIIASFHEAGHAIISYIVGWTIDTIKLQVENDILVNAVTKYDFGNDTENSIINLNRRVFCLVGGPISEAFYQNKNSINLNILGQDGITIDNLLNGISLPEKEKIIQQALNDVATLLNSENSQNASQEISKILIEKRSLSAIEFSTIMENNNIKRMKF